MLLTDTPFLTYFEGFIDATLLNTRLQPIARMGFPSLSPLDAALKGVFEAAAQVADDAHYTHFVLLYGMMRTDGGATGSFVVVRSRRPGGPLEWSVVTSGALQQPGPFIKQFPTVEQAALYIASQCTKWKISTGLVGDLSQGVHLELYRALVPRDVAGSTTLAPGGPSSHPETWHCVE